MLCMLGRLAGRSWPASTSLRWMATEASELRPGMLIEYEERIWEVLDSSSRKSARGGAKTSIDLREIGPNPRKKSITLRPVDRVDVRDLDWREVLYASQEELSADAQQKIKAGKPVPRILNLRDDDADETLQVDATEMGVAHLLPYLEPDMVLVLGEIDGSPIQLRFPRTVQCRVVEAAERDTKNASRTTCRLENGKLISVPKHVVAGETIVIELPSEEYKEKL